MGDWAASQHRKLEDSLNRVMDRHAHSLTPELAYAVERLTKSTLIAMLKGLAGMRARGEQLHPCWLYNAADEGVAKDASVLAEVIDHYNRLADSVQQIGLDEEQLWRNDVSPQVGSG